MHPLRPYQHEAVQAVYDKWENTRTTLVVLPTGMGKTRVASEVIARSKGRCLFLAHRDELITQAKAAIERDADMPVVVEKAASRAMAHGVEVVVGSVQTMKAARLARWPKDAFKTIIIDEAHRAAAKSYRAILDHFDGAKVLGITATPDRTDKRAMGLVFESVAYSVEMCDAISDGWLAPVRVREMYVDELDLSEVRTAMGDLSESDLERILCVDETQHRIAGPLVREVEDRQCLVFTPGVKSAYHLALVLSKYVGVPGKVAALDGSVDQESRQRIIADYRAGKIQYLVNCQLFTEGFDAPETSAIAICRPTKSRSLYAQMVGRGTRNAPGKTDCLVLDFRGNAGKHKLVNPVDILGGKYTEEERAMAARIVKARETDDLFEALKLAQIQISKEKLAREEYDRTRYNLLAKSKYQKQDIDPFTLIPLIFGVNVTPTSYAMAYATERQKVYLQRMGVQTGEGLSIRDASKIIEAIKTRQQKNLCTPKQGATLARWGMSTDVGFEEAKGIIDRAKLNNWFPTREDFATYNRQYKWKGET